MTHTALPRRRDAALILSTLFGLIVVPAATAIALTSVPAHHMPVRAVAVRSAATEDPTYRADGQPAAVAAPTPAVVTPTVIVPAPAIVTPDPFEQVPNILGSLLPHLAAQPEGPPAAAGSDITQPGAFPVLPGLPLASVAAPATPVVQLVPLSADIGAQVVAGAAVLSAAAAPAPDDGALIDVDARRSRTAPAAVAVVAPVVAVAAPVVARVRTAARAASAPLRGPDIASHQHDNGGVVNWNAAVRGGASFAFVKASEGSGGGGYINPYFAGDISALRRQGVIRSAYHFARPSGTTHAAIVADAVGEANFFVRIAGRLGAVGDLPAVLDLEDAGTLNPAQLSLWTRTWLATTTRLTGRAPILYTYVDFWRSQLGNSKGFTAYPLWLANYGVPKPAQIGGWKSYTFWQYSENARLAGVNRPVDMSVFNGSWAQLKAMANYKPAAKPAPKPVAKPKPVAAPAPTPPPATEPAPVLAAEIGPLVQGSAPGAATESAKAGGGRDDVLGATPPALLLHLTVAQLLGKPTPRG